MRCSICRGPLAASKGVTVCLLCDGVPPILKQLLDHVHEVDDCSSICNVCGAEYRAGSWVRLVP